MASGKNSQGGFQPDSDVHITFDDQQKINRFARQNAKMEDLKEELKFKQNELMLLDRAFDELELMDGDDAKINYVIGDVYVCQDVETTQRCLEEAKKQKEAEIENLEKKCEELKAVMTESKTQLYAKFGTRIYLEAEEE